ncbi:MAG: sugar transferase [Pseudomonadales bacterium]|nr:sugar transferase [Pseudomonadales bacterium]MDP6473025.1 sugar transferase [Pseudomonadales bacterium]MDP6973323.1 sugar transferase [Pseudomonadales bacterium]
MLSTLAFAATVDLLWLSGFISLDLAMKHVLLIPLVAFFSLIASVTGSPGLHNRTGEAAVVYVLRYTLFVLTGILMVTYFGRFEFVDRAIVASFTAVLTVGLILDRIFLKWWYFYGRKEHPANYLKVLIIGTGSRARELIRTYQAHSEWGVDIVGMLDPEYDPQHDTVDGVRVLGDVESIQALLSIQVVDEVIVCLPRSLINNIQSIVEACEEQAVCLKFMADVYDIATYVVHLEHIGDFPILNFEPVSHDEGKLVVKRIIDLAGAMVGILLLAPLFLLAALAIKLDSRGPVFFRQERVGLNKRPFMMMKFRSMYENAEARLAEIEHLNEAQGPIFKMARDPRVTRVGRVLRFTSVDELPQLFNVLFGHMSIIGPRPMSIRDYNLFSLGIQRKRFSVRPGLACLREISGRSKLSFNRWLELDLQYIDEWSLMLDFKIMLRIIPVVLKGEGAS